MTAANPRVFTVWLTLIVAAGVLPVVFVVMFGAVVGDALAGEAPVAALVVIGVLFVAMNAVPPLLGEASENLGDAVVGSYNERVMLALNADPRLDRLEDSQTADDITLARDFDLALSGPPVSVAMGLIASGMSQWLTGLCMGVVLCAFEWWAGALLMAAWVGSNWLMRETAIWHGRRSADVALVQREADYLYRAAVDAPAAKEVRLFGLESWVVDNFRDRRAYLTRLRIEATHMRERSLILSGVVLLLAYLLVLVVLAKQYAREEVELAAFLTFVFAALGTSGLAFGGFNWVLSMCGQVADALHRIESKTAFGSREAVGTTPPTDERRFTVELEAVGFTYPTSNTLALRDISLDVQAGSSLAIVGVNGAGKTTLAKLLSGLYLPTVGAIRMQGVDLRSADPEAWRHNMAVVFQDFVRYDLSLRDNVAPLGGEEADVRWALEAVGLKDLVDIDQQLGSGYRGSRELSGGQWQRVAIARALHRVRSGARLLILDEPTAQLDIDGEREVFEQILNISGDCATILISHRFATVRRADRICVVDDGRVAELGSHDELMAMGGIYHRMFTAQAQRFVTHD